MAVCGSCANHGHSLRGVPGSCSTPVRHIREFLTRILAAILTGLYSGSYCAVHAVRFAWEAYNAGAEHYQYTRACEILVKAGKLSPTVLRQMA
jgi:hypothetical protein